MPQSDWENPNPHNGLRKCMLLYVTSIGRYHAVKSQAQPVIIVPRHFLRISVRSKVMIPFIMSRIASISIEPGMKIPSCPSPSTTVSSTGIIIPLYSSEVMEMPSLSPCIFPIPVTSAFCGMTVSPARIGSNNRNLTACPSVMV